jgi:hypothetical protein
MAPLAIACTTSPPSARRGDAIIDNDEVSSLHYRVIGLTHVRLECADEVNVRARLEPGAAAR